MQFIRFALSLQTEMNKNLYIISGCNGAGKTTASYTVLPEILDCKEFVNADEIAKGLSPFNPESVAIEAGRLMLQRIENLLEKGETFSSPELALLRIAERVAKGGHNIPEPIVRRRYVAGINNLFRLFMNEVDYWDIYDNSQKTRIEIAYGGKEIKSIIFNDSLFKTIESYVK